MWGVRLGPSSAVLGLFCFLCLLYFPCLVVFPPLDTVHHSINDPAGFQGLHF